MPAREEVYRYKAEIDQQSIQQQVSSMRQAIGASMQMDSPSPTRNIMGYANAASIGFNSLTNDLASYASGLYQMAPSMPSMPKGNIGMSFTSSLAGMAGVGAPNTMYASDYAKLAKSDMVTRLARSASAMPLSALETAAEWGPSAYMGVSALAAGGGIFSGIGSAMGFGLSGTAFLGLTAAQAGIGYAAGGIRDELKSQSRFENMIHSISRGRKGFSQKANIARHIRGVAAGTAKFSTQEAAEVLAYGTENELLDINQDVEEYKRNYSGLVKSVQTIMKTFSQTAKDAVQTMRSMKDAGLFSTADIREGSMLMKARSEMARMDPSRMMRITTAGAQMGRSTIGAKAGRDIAGFGGQMITKMMDEGTISKDRLFELTGEHGVAGREKMAMAATRGLIQFTQANNMGVYAMAALRDPKTGDALKTALQRGDSDAINRMLHQASGRLADTDPLTLVGEARDDLKKMPFHEQMRMMAGMTKTLAGQYDLDMGNIHHVRGILRDKMGITDESSVELYSKFAQNPDIIDRLRAEERSRMVTKRIRDRKEKDSFFNKVRTAPDRMWDWFVDPFVEARQIVGGTIEGAFAEKQINIMGGDLADVVGVVGDAVDPRSESWAKEARLKERQAFFGLVDKRKRTDTGFFDEMFIGLSKGSIVGDPDKLALGQYVPEHLVQQAGLSQADMLIKHRKEGVVDPALESFITQARSRDIRGRAEFKQFAQKKSKTLSKTMSKVNLSKFRDDESYRKMVRKELEAGGSEMRFVDAVMTGLMDESGKGTAAIGGMLGVIQTEETMRGVKTLAADGMSTIGTDVEGMGTGLEYALAAAGADDITKAEISAVSKYAGEFDKSKFKNKDQAESIQLILDTVRDLESGKRSNGAESDSAERLIKTNSERVVAANEGQLEVLKDIRGKLGG